MPKTILLVDDDRLVIEIVRRKLEQEGYQIQAASNGVEAFEYLKLQTPDLIILDVHMPDMNGYSFIMRKNRTPEYKPIPVVMLTASKDTGPLFKRYGVKGYLIKPINLQELMDKVTEVVGNA